MKSKNVVAALAALAQDARLAIYRLLVEAGPAGLPAGEIGKSLSIPAPTLSFHLAQLQQAGLVTRRRNGRQLIQAAAFDRMNAVIAYLTENCCGGDMSACATVGTVKCTPKSITRAKARKKRMR
ncbi:MAG: ArsR family transcriptional regulator [Rhodospirillaceae bacterium]|nr:MAG: ArsR family transcriptional regulator [Rhodospirillaceae bacterium]